MTIEERLIIKIDNFAEVYEKQLHEDTSVYLCTNDIYYRAHAYLEVLSLIEENEKIRALKEKLRILTETVLDKEK